MATDRPLLSKNRKTRCCSLVLHLACASSLVVCQGWVTLTGVFGILTYCHDVIDLQSESGLSKTSGCYKCSSQSSASDRHRSPEKARREVRLHHVSLVETEWVLVTAKFVVLRRSEPKFRRVSRIKMKSEMIYCSVIVIRGSV